MSTESALSAKMDALADKIAAELLDLAGDSQHVVLGPVMLAPEPPGNTSYFIVGVVHQGEWYLARLQSEEWDFAEDLRPRLIFALACDRPMVIHATDDEQRMVQLCHAIRPTPRTEQLCRDIAEEYAGR